MRPRLSAGLLLLGSIFMWPSSVSSMVDRPSDVLNELRVGHWVEVRGQLRTDGVFEAERIEWLAPRRTAVLWGVAWSPASNSRSEPTIEVLGRSVVLPDVSEPAPIGTRLKLAVERAGGGALRALEYSVRRPGVERIEGRVDRIRRGKGGLLALDILGFEIELSSEVRQRREEGATRFPRVLPRPLDSAFRAQRDLDDFGDQGFQLGAGTHLWAEQRIGVVSRRNEELRSDISPDPDELGRDDATNTLRFRMSHLPNARTAFVVEASHRLRHRDDAEFGADWDSRSSLREAWVLIRDVAGLDLQFGRQDFDEPREWLYDEQLDGARAYWRGAKWFGEFSLSGRVDDGSSRSRSALNTILYVGRDQARRHLGAYVIDRSFGDEIDERQTHAGVRFLGSLGDAWSGWAELSSLRGTRSGRDVAGWGADLGLRFRSRARLRPRIAIGYAVGSGDDGGSSDRRFRQTGLQDNSARLIGMTPIKYYGEVLDPELSNLAIEMVAFSVRPHRSLSVELVGHRYRQHRAARSINSDVDRRPNGISRDIGWGVDLIAAWVPRRSQAKWYLELVAGTFEPGDAFVGRNGADRRPARLFALQFVHRF